MLLTLASMNFAINEDMLVSKWLAHGLVITLNIRHFVFPFCRRLKTGLPVLPSPCPLLTRAFQMQVPHENIAQSNTLSRIKTVAASVVLCQFAPRLVPENVAHSLLQALGSLQQNVWHVWGLRPRRWHVRLELPCISCVIYRQNRCGARGQSVFASICTGQARYTSSYIHLISLFSLPQAISWCSFPSYRVPNAIQGREQKNWQEHSLRSPGVHS